MPEVSQTTLAGLWWLSATIGDLTGLDAPAVALALTALHAATALTHSDPRFDCLAHRSARPRDDRCRNVAGNSVEHRSGSRRPAGRPLGADGRRDSWSWPSDLAGVETIWALCSSWSADGPTTLDTVRSGVVFQMLPMGSVRRGLVPYRLPAA